MLVIERASGVGVSVFTTRLSSIGYGGSFTTKVRRVVLDISISIVLTCIITL